MSELARQVGIDSFFLAFFGRGAQFNDICPQAAYLDLETGNVLQVFADDGEGERNYGVAPGENRELRERVAGAEERYLEIPGLNRANHHEILTAFLESEWTEDEGTRLRVRNAFKDSIADWIGTVGCDTDAVRAYSGFRDARVEAQAREFLTSHRIEPIWR